MTAEHSDTDIVTGGHRAAQQMIFTVTQLVETVARMRQAAEARRADAARAAQAQAQAQAAEWAADRDQWNTAVVAAAREGTDRAAYAPAATPTWRRDAAPVDLLTAWAAATTWAAHDPKAAEVMVATEDEMRDRWPQVIDRYDRLRVADGLHPAAAMKTALTDAANAGWDPTTNPAAQPRGGRAAQAALTADATERTATSAASAADAAPRPVVVNPAAQALRWIPTAAAALTTTATVRPGSSDDHRTAATRVSAPAPHRGR